MNRQLHRVIFSRARGRCMAVPESAASGQRSSGARFSSIATALAWLLAAPWAQAQIIADPAAPGAERPIVLRAANGTPLVQIQTPSSAGVSRNRYQQFDIGQQGERGAILNNSRGAAQSLTGGAVPGNPWLARGSARVIVNEVRSQAQSRLAGTLEVAGPRADVIIANPSGLVVNGLSLINAAGLTLAGGEALYRPDGQLDGFRVTRGAIQIEGRGLDASQTDYAQVLARAIALNAGVWAQDLRMVTGANHLAADSALQPYHAEATSPDTPEKPQFALDVAQLGGMYARKILLIGTEAGLGVRNAGVLLADTGALTLSANGQLRNAGVIATQGADAELQLSARGIDNSGRLSSQGEMVLMDGGGDTVNSGRIDTASTLRAQAGQLTNQAVGAITAQRLDIMATRLDNAGRIAQTGAQALSINSLAISNAGEKAVLGTPMPSAETPAPGAAPQPPEPSTPAPNPSEAPQPAPPSAQPALERGSIHVVQRLANTGELLANGPTDIKAIHSLANSATARLRHLHSEGLLDNRQGTLQMQRLTGAQASLQNQGGSILVADDLRLVVARQIDNTGGTIGSARGLNIKAQTVTNDAGTLSAGADITLNAQTLENNREARIASPAGGLKLTLGAALNNQQGRIMAMKPLEIDSASLNNAGGTLMTTGAGSLLRITSGAGVDNSASGLIQSSGALQLDAGAEAVNNTSGTMRAQEELRLQSRGPVDNNLGHLVAGQQLVLRDAGVAAGAAVDQATQTLSNQDGRLFAAQGLEISNQGLAGSGRLDAQGDLTLDLAGDITHPGTMAANGKLKLSTLGKLVNQGQLLGGSGTELKAAWIDNQPAAQISAQQTTTVKSTQTFTNRGLVDGQDTRIDADAVDNLAAGQIFGDHVSIAAQKLENRPEDGGATAPVIVARQGLNLGVPVIINKGGALLQSLGNIRLGQSLDANRIATGNGLELRNTGARIDAQGNIDFDTRDVHNLNAELRIERLGEVQKINVGEMISLFGKAPEIASLYKELDSNQFVPFYQHRGSDYPEMGIRGHVSDGRMFKPAHVDRFPHVPPAAFIDPKGTYQNGVLMPEDAPLYLEPEGSPRFKQFGVAVPANYTSTAPDPLKYGGVKEESGRIGWQSLAEQRAYDAAVVVYQESIATAQKLHAEILKVVEEDNRILDSARLYTAISNARQTIERDKIIGTQPGLIEAGGNITAPGKFNNIDSTVRAGGEIIAPHAKNPGRQGTQKTLTEGDAIRYEWKYRGAFKNKQQRQALDSTPFPYSYTHIGTYHLPTVVFKEHASLAPAAPVDPNANTGNAARRPTPVVREQIIDPQRRVRTLESAGFLPQTSLYALNPASPDRPLVETHPAFTRGGQPTSSAEMLPALDPALLQKRLGDGFYEQQLVQQQVGLLTGRRFLGEYRSNDAQYQALLQSGATFAKAHGLRPGVALSAAQMAELTSDLVWLVEETVTLPDASQQKVLVPKVYVVARPGDLDIQGGLMSADRLVIDTAGDMDNSATLAGRYLVSIKAHDINNVGGHIVGRVVNLQARRDMNMHGGTVTATQALLANAGRDIHAESTGNAPGSGAPLNRRAAFVLRPGPGSVAEAPAPGEPPPPSGLHLFARRDIHLRGVQIVNAVEGSETSIFVQRDLDLSTLGTSRNEGVIWNPKNRLLLASSQEVGTEIDTKGLTHLLAVRDINARAAQIHSTGHLGVAAGGSVRITPGQATRSLDDAYYARRSGLLSSSSKTLTHQIESSQAQPSHLMGKTLHIQAGQDIDLIGSKARSHTGTLLQAKRNVNILAQAESASQQSRNQSRRSGVFGGKGLGLAIGSQSQSTAQSLDSTARAPSVVGSVAGSTIIIAGNAYRQIGSEIFADRGDVGVGAKSITITGVPETAQGSMRSTYTQSGVGLALHAPLIGMAQTASSLADAAGKTSSSRMQGLAVGAVALDVYNQRKALQALSSGELKDLEPRIGISVGQQQSHSRSAYASSTMRRSAVRASGNVSLVATGAGEQSNLVIQDSNVHADGEALLFADNQIRLLGTSDTSSASSHQSSRSASLGLSLGASGPAFDASASQGSGQTFSEDQSHRQTQVTAGKRVHIQSGGNTVLRDAAIRAPRVTSHIGGRLILRSLQDTSRFDGKQSNRSGSMGLGAGSALGSGAYGASSAHGNYASVNRQTGIFTEHGGFQLVVKEGTDLGGGVIASTQEAIDAGVNSLLTRTITHSNIENRSDYSASGLHMSGGVSFGGEKPAKSPGSDTVTNPTGWAAQNQGRQGIDSAGAGYSSDQGSERSVTRSGVSPGALIVTDDAAQRALTGQSAAEAVASVNRDVRTEDPSQGLRKKWDGQRLMDEQDANAEIGAAFGQQVSRTIGTYAKEQMGVAADLRQQARQDPARAAELTEQAQAIESKWGDKGVLRLGSHGVVGALTSGVLGAVGSVVGTVAAPVVADALRNNNAPTSLVKGITALASTAAGGLIGGGAGAAAAFNEVTGNFLPDLYVNIVKSCLSGNTCPDNASKEEVLKNAEAISQNYDNTMRLHCNDSPTSDNCKRAVVAATEYLAMTEAWEVMRSDVSRSSNILFDHLYNSPKANERLADYFEKASEKSIFYRASDLYERNIGAGAKWHGAAETATRSPLIGGGGFFTSAIPFAAGNFAAPLSSWRSEASSKVMREGFESFKNLYTNKHTDPLKWDIDLLKKEQSILQPIHEKHFKNNESFVNSIKNFTNSNHFLSKFTPEEQKIEGGLNLLDKKSRIQYGCKLLGYSEKQGCKP